MLSRAGFRHSRAITQSPVLRSSQSQRQFSSLNSARNNQLRLSSVHGNGSALSALRLSRSSGPLRMSPRFASTTATSSAITSTPSESATAPVTGGITPGSDALSGGSLADIDLSQVPEKIGYLKELGLDYGWGPSSMIQLLLETLHITGGLPWWTATVAAAVLIRVVLFNSIVSAADVSTKLKALSPRTTPIRERMMRCVRENDNVGAMKAKQELASLNQEHGIKPWKAFIPLLQVPLGFGCFRVLRGMSALPVPGLDSESVLWLQSVTMPDPFFVMPVATGALMFVALKRGGDVGMSNLMNSALGKGMVYGLPIVTVCTMTFWPGILQLYFLTTGALSVCQTYIMTTPRLRKLVGLGPLPKKPTSEDSSMPAPSRIQTISKPTTSQPTPETHIPPQNISVIDRTMDGLKSAYKDTVKDVKNKLGEMTGEKEETDPTGRTPRLNKKELENAKAYEERRRAEIRAERELKNQQLRARHMRKRGQKE
ncbi:hypothetical protein H109_03406 [Trichophyton interdigitale MR816]|uniref:Membrane insertase YidC/Oxa/ALB C-terminal domain-containing protein n=1 Tax=Trichophyton interdigitale (strain MR816) TaxID=1215338 RepID=A0A059JAG8_TRIIM|nr:hypothetical protein H101_00699 [Trichophyton interdigitale H6]KDB24774.1 hypothetical protein H109_03406 [Trichophyton interdigitale MR816]